MGTRDPRIDAYIAKSADFARPILTHIRDAVHSACPDVEETMKWSFPHFMYKGMLCSMAAFKEHCAFGFWKGALVTGDTTKGTEAMGNFGRITKVSELPSKSAFAGYVKKAMQLNEENVPRPKTKVPKAPRKEIPVPGYFASALAKNRKAQATFDAFSPSHRRDYLEWITEAKQPETRERRMAQAIEWLSEGKSRNWKYEKC
jgi:uncharacterized protein YdeI (YjbR/CyaY-like superfamily)